VGRACPKSAEKISITKNNTKEWKISPLGTRGKKEIHGLALERGINGRIVRARRLKNTRWSRNSSKGGDKWWDRERKGKSNTNGKKKAGISSTTWGVGQPNKSRFEGLENTGKPQRFRGQENGTGSRPATLGGGESGGKTILMTQGKKNGFENCGGNTTQEKTDIKGGQ